MLFDLLNSDYNFSDLPILLVGHHDDKSKNLSALLNLDVRILEKVADLKMHTDTDFGLAVFSPDYPHKLAARVISKLKIEKLIFCGVGNRLPIGAYLNALHGNGYGFDPEFQEFAEVKLKLRNGFDVVQLVKGGLQYIPGVDAVSQYELAKTYFWSGNWAPLSVSATEPKGLYPNDIRNKKSVKIVLRIEGLLRRFPLLFVAIRWSIVLFVRIVRLLLKPMRQRKFF